MYRLIAIIILSIGFSEIVKSQEITYNYIDSMSYHQYLQGEWDHVLQTGKIAEKSAIYFPLLYMRMGYAAFMKGNYSLSLKHYNKALKFNSYNQDALYYIAYNNTLLLRKGTAIFGSKNLSNELKTQLKINSKQFIDQIDIETSIKPTNTELRETGQYYRAGFGNRINYRWKLYQSFATYRQNMLANDSARTFGRPGLIREETFRTYLVNDFQYYIKSELFLNSKISLINALHYTKTNFDDATYKTAIFNCGLKLTEAYADYKLEINAGSMLDSLLTQVAISSTYYPFGNLKFYGNSRLSYQNRTNLSQLNYTQMFGFKLHQKVWFETHATFGQIKNLIDNESLYIYDALDKGKYRIGASLLIPFTTKFSLLTNYYFEQKKLYLQNTNYHLHSFSIGISWKL